MMGRYTIRAYIRRPNARISTERYDDAQLHSVSRQVECEKQVTASRYKIHIHLHRPTFLHRQSHIAHVHATTKIATKQHGYLCLTHGNQATAKPERWRIGTRKRIGNLRYVEATCQNQCLAARPQTQFGGKGMSRTKRLREEVHKFLAERGRANTVEVFDHLNERFSWGATMNQVGNILAKDSRFEKVGSVRDFFRGARYSVCIWSLSGRHLGDSGPTKATA